jgi:hypothetical protein
VSHKFSINFERASAKAVYSFPGAATFRGLATCPCSKIRSAGKG